VPYVYEYFGWRQPLANPKSITKAGNKIDVSWKNIAVPKRKQVSAQAALAASKVAANRRAMGLAHARAAAQGTRKVATVSSVLKEGAVVAEMQKIKAQKAAANKQILAARAAKRAAKAAGQVYQI
jgi:hypothetical protein